MKFIQSISCELEGRLHRQHFARHLREFSQTPANSVGPGRTLGTLVGFRLGLGRVRPARKPQIWETTTCFRGLREVEVSARLLGQVSFVHTAWIVLRKLPAEAGRAHTIGNGWPSDPPRPSNPATSHDRTRKVLPEHQSILRSKACPSADEPEKQKGLWKQSPGARVSPRTFPRESRPQRSFDFDSQRTQSCWQERSLVLNSSSESLRCFSPRTPSLPHIPHPRGE